jgi:hypothetical protein
MKSGFKAGALAGFISWVVALSISLILYYMRILVPAYYTPPPTQTIPVSFILLVFWGALWGFIYSNIYNAIPGKGILKGLYFGLVIWFLVEVNVIISVVFVEGLLIGGLTKTVLASLSVGFIIRFVYGIALGALYKK